MKLKPKFDKVLVGGRVFVSVEISKTTSQPVQAIDYKR